MTEPIVSLDILGYRGFATRQRIDFAVPDGDREGSGLTVVVGPNNAGKSSIYEALRMFVGRGERRFSEARRNKRAGDRVEMTARTAQGYQETLRTVPAGGANAEWEPEASAGLLPKIHLIPSRRAFPASFGAGRWGRSLYSENLSNILNRQANYDSFAYRLQEAQQNKAAFDAVLSQMIDPVPQWYIDERDDGQMFVRVVSGGSPHTSEGLGEGFLSMLFIADALYDAPQGSMIVVDEPELSIHPAALKKIAALLFRESRNKQIICFTHSPYFLSIPALGMGGRIARVHQTATGSTVSMLSVETGRRLTAFLANRNNPHVVGLDAREAFFLDDRVILVEGQEDVQLYPTLFEQLGRTMPGDFYGWGIGGAGNMRLIAQTLKELGFQRVGGILDADKATQLEELRDALPAYFFAALPADDVRDKVATASPAKRGVLDTELNLKPDLREATLKVAEDLTTYLRS